MANAAPPSAMLDVRVLAALLMVSVPTVWRMRESQRLPEPIRLTAQTVRWRRRTGNPATGIEDWLEAGCPSCNDQSQTTPASQVTA